MVELLWAFGSMLIVMLIVYFLPLGLTIKGKVILVITSFLLALGGIAATSSFSFLLAVLILVILTLFVTYLLDQRLGKWLYSEDDPITGKQEIENTFINTEMETAASLEKVYPRKNEDTLEPLTLLKDKKEKNSRTEPKQDSETEIPLFETPEEDISFLLNRSITMEKETSKKPEEQKQDEVDYLAEIEELLNDDLDDLEIPVISFEDKPLKKKTESSTGQAKKIEDFDVIPVLPFHEKEGEQS